MQVTQKGRQGGFTSEPSWPLVVLAASIMMPRELSFKIGELSIYADRAVLLAFTPMLLHKLLNGSLRLRLPDGLIFFAYLWTIFSLSQFYDFGRVAQSGGSLMFDAMASYLLARAGITDVRDLRVTLIRLSPVIFAIGLILAIESITSTPLIRPFFSAVFGGVDSQIVDGRAALQGQNQYRFGLLRATGPFVHPILAGLTVGVFFTLFLLSGLRGWPKTIGVIGSLAGVFTGSSAALLMLASGFAIKLTDVAVKNISSLRWTHLFSIAAVAIFAIEVFSQNGFISVASRYASLNSSTAYYRLLIWDYGSASVANAPLFGIGFSDWVRPSWLYSSTVDNHWLLLAMRFGIITPTILLLVIVFTCISLIKKSATCPAVDRSAYIAITSALAVYTLLAWTVALFGSSSNLLMLLLGTAVSLSSKMHGEVQAVRKAFDRLRRTSRSRKPEAA
ncbi:glycosyltransferase [Sphingomonadaceae bacterium]|nr:glycosyltransferase [Sphingomonadaceae bacterium]